MGTLSSKETFFTGDEEFRSGVAVDEAEPSEVPSGSGPVWDRRHRQTQDVSGASTDVAP